MRQPETILRPYIYTQKEIGRLMAAARKLFSPRGLRCHTYYHLVGLLVTTGMRSGEAVRLKDGDVNLAEGLLTIRESKSRPLLSLLTSEVGRSTAPTRAFAIFVARPDWTRVSMESIPECTICAIRSLCGRCSFGTATEPMSSAICRSYQRFSGTAMWSTLTGTYRPRLS